MKEQKIKLKINWALKLIILLALLLIFSEIVLSLGVGPSRQFISYDPGGVFEGELLIINDGGDAFKAAIYAQGDFAEYVTIEEPLFDVAASESTKKARFEINFPEEPPKPGNHKLELIVRQFPADSSGAEGTMISARMAVISQAIIKVPYPGKYAEGKFLIGGAKDNSTPAIFTVMLYNFGLDKIGEAYAKVEIFGPTWEKIADVETNKESLDSKQEKKLEARWRPDVNQGTYRAVATVHYDGNQFKMEQNFDVGKFLIDVSDISVAKFRLGDVAKFDIRLYNSWNTEIKDVYVEMTVENEAGKQMTQFKTGVIDIPAERQGKLEAYWYTDGVAPGIYTVKLLVHYAGKVTQKEYDIEVSTNSIRTVGVVGQAITAEELEEVKSQGVLIMLVIIVLVLLVGMNVAWFVVFSRHFKNNERGKGGEEAGREERKKQKREEKAEEKEEGEVK